VNFHLFEIAIGQIVGLAAGDEIGHQPFDLRGIARMLKMRRRHVRMNQHRDRKTPEGGAA